MRPAFRIVMCLVAGLYVTIRTRFMQVRGFVEMLRLTIGGQKSDARPPERAGRG